MSTISQPQMDGINAEFLQPAHDQMTRPQNPNPAPTYRGAEAVKKQQSNKKGGSKPEVVKKQPSSEDVQKVIPAFRRQLFVLRRPLTMSVRMISGARPESTIYTSD